MMDWYDGGLSWGGWLAMTMMMVVFWGAVAFVLVALFRGFGTRGSQESSRPERSSLEILDDRFARGEIDEQEYRARQEVLRRTGGDLPTSPGR